MPDAARHEVEGLTGGADPLLGTALAGAATQE